jgi:tRNA(Leu) C34 or U34 (ribose-2'-O)-methylase TrmL
MTTHEARTAGARLFELSREAFAKVAYRERPDGLLAVAPQWKRTLADMPLSATPFLLVVESIEKPGNLGTILRSADAAGCDAVIVCDPVTDLFNPNVVRASTGVLFSVPCVVAGSEEVQGWLKERGIRTIATTPAAQVLYSDADLRGPLAVVMGSEQYGLSEFWLAKADLPPWRRSSPCLKRCDSAANRGRERWTWSGRKEAGPGVPSRPQRGHLQQAPAGFTYGGRRSVDAAGTHTGASSPARLSSMRWEILGRKGSPRATGADGAAPSRGAPGGGQSGDRSQGLESWKPARRRTRRSSRTWAWSRVSTVQTQRTAATSGPLNARS